MNKTDYRLIFGLLSLFVLAGCYLYPSSFGADNHILTKFVSEGFINFMGIVVTITLGSAANTYLQLRKIEHQAEQEIFLRTKAALRKSSFSLILLLAVSVVLIFIKGTIEQDSFAQAYTNAAAILVMIFSILVIFDLTKLALKI